MANGIPSQDLGGAIGKEAAVFREGVEPASPQLDAGTWGWVGSVTWRLRNAGPERVLTTELNPGFRLVWMETAIGIQEELTPMHLLLFFLV